MAGAVLFTFPPSLDSEFSRFVLHHYRVSAHEERHVILIQSLVTLVKVRTPLIPTLAGGDVGRLVGVKKIIDHFEAIAPPERKLYVGVDDATRQADWQAFHRVLQSATTVFPYYHLLPRRDLMVRAISEGSPRWEVEAVRRAYPVFELSLRALLRLSAARANEARNTIFAQMDMVERRLSDGRRFLNGDRFTVSDLGFAIAAAPAIWPDNYGGPLPPLEETPAAVQELVAEARERPAGKFAMGIYGEFRGQDTISLGVPPVGA
jgi:glutathione S-transferase